MRRIKLALLFFISTCLLNAAGLQTQDDISQRQVTIDERGNSHEERLARYLGGAGNPLSATPASSTALPCAVDSDTCLQTSPQWILYGDDYDCHNAKTFCSDWAKDMHRCCPQTCNVAPVCTLEACKALGYGVSGDCVYPNAAMSGDQAATTAAPTAPTVAGATSTDAGGYVIEDIATNSCSGGRVKLESKPACKNAASYLDKNFIAEEDVQNFPGGCYVYGSIGSMLNVYWNTALSSRSNARAAPICTTQEVSSDEDAGDSDACGLWCEEGKCIVDTATGVSTCAVCSSPYYLSRDGNCVERCPLGYEEIDQDGHRECKMCYGETRRRETNKPTECKGCPNGEIAFPDHDECQNIQDTCTEDQCEACAECLERAKWSVSTCITAKDPDATCLFPGKLWCDQLHTHCQSSGYGCFFKLRCQSPCICDSWKAINCGDKKVPEDKGQCDQELADAAWSLSDKNQTSGIMRRAQASTGHSAAEGSLSQRIERRHASRAKLESEGKYVAGSNQNLDNAVQGKCQA